MVTSLWERASRPIDPRGLAAFRIGFGLLLLFLTARTAAYGWIEALYVAPAYHFTWEGLEFVRPWPGVGMYVHFALMGGAALGIALGARYRLSAAAFCALFTWVELIDKALYLNHYYFVSVMTGLMASLPLHGAWSWDARRGRAPAAVGAWASWAVRVQVGLVYVYAGIAKINADWLVEAQPLRIWLANHADLPVVGPWMGAPWLAYVMSWCGMLYDLSVPFWLLWRPTRAAAYASVVLFHVVTWALFPIGVFPWVMIAAATVFFAHDWPGRWVSAPSPQARAAAPPRWLAAVVALHLALQVAAPWRHLLYPGEVNWTEEGFRFAWRVMLVEKGGYVEYEVQTRAPARRWSEAPGPELTAWQRKAMLTQPDMIVQYAHRLRARVEAEGYEGVEVRAQARVSWNGRSSAALIDPGVDLGSAPRGLAPARWLLPAPGPLSGGGE